MCVCAQRCDLQAGREDPTQSAAREGSGNFPMQISRGIIGRGVMQSAVYAAAVAESHLPQLTAHMLGVKGVVVWGGTGQANDSALLTCK